jgi:lipopolysaccharide export system protein LptC
MRGLRQPLTWGGAAWPLRLWFGRRFGPTGGDPYSRRVALLKRVLPAIGLGLVLLVAAWPRLKSLIESVRLEVPAIDLREARELKMVNPRYTGVDRHNRPFVVTAAIGRQSPDRDDLMSLEGPVARLHPHTAATIRLTAASAIYQSQAQLLDLFDNVNLWRDDGTRFVTSSAHVNLADDSADGHDFVVGHGPAGDLSAQGFRVLAKGDTIVFTGKADLLLNGSRPPPHAAEPVGLPPAVSSAAAQVEAAALAPDPAEKPARLPGRK